MTESFFERHARVQRRLTAGRAGKPEFNIDIDIRTPVVVDAPSIEMAPLFEPAQERGPDEVVRATISDLPIGAKVRDWLKLVRELCGEKSVSVRDLWVRIDVRPEAKCVTLTTNLGVIVVAYRDPTPVAGILRLFTKFIDFAKAIEEDGATRFSVQGRKLTYVGKGQALSIGAMDNIKGDPLTPFTPPLSGYKMVKDLGLALREAAFFTKKTPDANGRHKVLLWRRNDATGTVDVIGCGGTLHDEHEGVALIYRREVQAPDIRFDLFLDPLRSLSSEGVLPDSLGYCDSGSDFVWLLGENGFIIGLASEPCPVPERGFLAYLNSPNGRIEFATQDMEALRRAVAQIRINPETVGEKEMVLRPRGLSHALEFGTAQNIQSVECNGDMGPETISVNSDLLSHALSVRGIHAIEFDRQNEYAPLLLVGPSVRVALQPLLAKK